MFDTQQFIADCQAAAAADPTHKAVHAVVAEAVADPAAVLAGLGEPTEAGVTPLHHAPDLTILNVVWAPLMTIRPHDHQMWAVIGIYTGGEDNIYWRRTGDRIEAAGAQAMRPRDATPLGPDIVHSVTNPTNKLTGAIHVYGGDFFAVERSEWDADDLTQRPYDIQRTVDTFAEANARYLAGH